jgi:ABC-type antimicrobial peptide transport system permease subunit
LRSLLFQVSERDPGTFLVLALGLATIGVLASAIPAQRATRVDPLDAMREM